MSYASMVALGDSFTEGLEDEGPDGRYRGWADLVAGELATRNPEFRYANLAVRGRRLARIRDEQVPRALAMQPDLVTLSGGGNDIIGFRCDVPALSRMLHEVLNRLAGTGATVIALAGFDPRGRLPLGRVLAARAAAYNDALADSADQVGARVVDLWHQADLYQDVMWASDRLHLSSRGHAVVAAEAVRRDWVSARRADAAWVRTYFAPWVARQVRGRSAGDLVEPKRGKLTVLPTVSAD
jgi:lysophospholipase L1-like esterase